MAREIKFRGKRIDNGEWVYGFYWFVRNRNDTKRRIFIKTYEVIPETIGKYIGMKDKSGREIFEGDKISVENDCEHTCVIDWDEVELRWMLVGENFVLDLGANFCSEELEVIGNIHEEEER